ncbi:Ribose-phosphate pyrophosphokinase [Candidatus Entotheonellaceae bacterium PAL068K]
MREGTQRVFAGATHAVLLGRVMQQVAASNMQELVMTDTVSLGDKSQEWGQVQMLSVAHLLGEAIRRIHDDESVSSLFV